MKKFLLATLIIFFLFGGCNFAYAYMIEELNFSNEGDIVIGPGKTEVFMNPGTQYTKEIIVSNRSGMDKIIDISVEDFEGSVDANGSIKFLGDTKSPYSLKDYVKPEINQITLHHGQRLRLPVEISVPDGVEPGGLYGAVMISASNIKGEDQTTVSAASGKVAVITRVASLFFVRVNGDALEEGALKDFKTDKNFYEKGPVTFKIINENTGNVHLSPYGTIDIKNILGAQVGSVELDPWFVMPKSLRTREVKWNTNFLFGRYTAVVTLNRGYEDIIDKASFTFWVIPWKLVAIAVIGLILFLLFIIWLITHLEFKKGPKGNQPLVSNQPVAPPQPLPPPSDSIPPTQQT